jgi:DNA mismatch endonuclease (patch repair protein)
MSRIRGKDTGPELAVRKALWALRLRYRVHPAIAGRPDIVFAGARVAVFIDGCFWHGCALHGVKPKSNREFWRTKFRKNQSRDRKVTRLLEADGWAVLRYWEHDVKDDPLKVTSQIAKSVRARTRRRYQAKDSAPLSGR